MAHLRWQALLAVLGMVLLGTLLGYYAYSISTVSEPDYGGTYVEGLAGQPNIVNPLYSHLNAVDRDLTALIFNGLTRVDESNTIQPDLAKSWSISPDGLNYTFTLRSDVKWSDGASFEADDVLYTLHVLQAPEYIGLPTVSNLWRTVAITAVNPSTIRFQLSEPFAPFLEFTAIGILPSHLLKNVGAADLLQSPFNRKPVGTGPFVLDELNSQHALLHVNPRYAGPRPYLSGIEFRFYPGWESAFAAYGRNQIEGLAQIDTRSLTRARQTKTLTLYNAPLSGYSLIFLNLTRAPFNSKELRQALLYGTNRNTIVDEILSGQGIVATSPILRNSWAFDNAIPQYPFDPAKADSLLTAGGWMTDTGGGPRLKNNQPLSFVLTTNGDDQTRVAIANELAKQWRVRGISVTVQTVPAASLVQDVLRPRQFDAVLFGFAQLPADPDPYSLWNSTQTPDRTGAGQNYGGWNNRDVDEALEQARRASDRGTRADLYQQFQEIFADEVPALLLYYTVYTYAVDSSVHGVQIGPLLTPSDRLAHIDQWYIKTRRVILSEAQRTVVP